MEIFYTLIALTVVAALVYVAFKMFIFIIKLVTSPSNNTNVRNGNSLNEGDYRSEPEGYSPNTGYQDSHYGNIYNNDEEDEHH